MPAQRNPLTLLLLSILSLFGFAPSPRSTLYSPTSHTLRNEVRGRLGSGEAGVERGDGAKPGTTPLL